MKYAILGKGVSGRSAAALIEVLGGEIYFFADGDSYDPRDLHACDLAVVSPGFSRGSPLYRAVEAAGIEIISELELAARHFPGRYLAITGTNGKTTTTELTVHLLQASGINAMAVGNIGHGWCELTAEVLSGKKDVPLAVVEVSSFQLEHIHDFAPLAAVVLNIASDHLDRYHDSLKEYTDTKGRIFLNVQPGNRILGASLLHNPPYQTSGNRITLPDANSLCLGNREILRFSNTLLKGIHNLENLAAAMELVRCAAGDDALFSPELKKAAESFLPGAHRLELVAERNGILFVNDSKATNPHAVLAALTAVGDQTRLILGGLDKGMDFNELQNGCNKIKQAYIMGKCRDKIYDAIHNYCDCQCYDDFDSAVKAAIADAQPGETVLLSPACASMDMFRDYRERGERFKAIVLDTDK